MPKNNTSTPPSGLPPADSAPLSNLMAADRLKRLLPWIIVGAVVVIAVVTLAIQHRNSQKLSRQVADLRTNPQKVAQDQTKALLDKVGSLIVLPADEQPTVATVTDLKPLQDQPFFAHAEVGDKVLIYTNAKKAILYRESLNKIIEVAPLNIGSSQAPAPQVAGDSTTTPPVNAKASAKTPAPKK